MSTPPDWLSAQPYRLDGRHALVTGGASGIGEATVKELARAGAFVWIADINGSAAESLAASVGFAQALPLDVTDTDSIAAAPLFARATICPASSPSAASRADF